jgi:hypothetical protein
MSEPKAYETSPFEKQKINFSRKRKDEFVLLQLLLGERLGSVREGNPRGRKEEGAYHTPLVQLDGF